MKKIFSFSLVWSFLSLFAFSAGAQEATITLTPEPGEYETLPSEFVINVDGPVSIKKNVLGGNPLLITAPDGTTQQLTGTFSDLTVTCKLPSSPNITLDQKGEYKVSVRANSITFTWDDGTTSKTGLVDFFYTVTGTQGEDPDVPKEVAYDVEMIKTIPSLNPFDLEMKDLETVQIYFNMPNLELDPNVDPTVTITGPNYNSTTVLKPNMNMATATVFKAAFDNPKYNGDYTLVIPEGILGDKDWIEDHSTGHTNPAIEYNFTVVGGLDPSTITKDLTFNPRVTPAVGSKVTDLSEITLSFDSMPYWDEEATVNVYCKTDLAAMGNGSKVGTAVFSRGEGNDVILSLTTTDEGQYLLTLPEEFFRNAEDVEEATKFNGEMSLNWYYNQPKEKVEVVGHIPATDARVGYFAEGEPGIVIITDVKDVVASADFKVLEYKLGSDSAGKTILNTTSSDFNEDGYICWINNTGSVINLSDECYYEVDYTLKNQNGVVLTDGMFEFYGDVLNGAIEITTDNTETVIYNLYGQKVKGENLPAGIYIMNGKKVLVK